MRIAKHTGAVIEVNNEVTGGVREHLSGNVEGIKSAPTANQ